ncbi:MAG: hypothetical protein LBB52_09300 [Desulfovibrio sp.]|jgi:hypothetical protein|nr:hypothetical protein [Desulfovibrio sp.]
MGGEDTGAEKIFLRGDNGAEFQFTGKQYGGTSYFDEETGTLTLLRLYITENREQVFSFISGSELEKRRIFYIVSKDGEMYRISNGIQTLTLPEDLLFATVFGLCGINPEQEEEFKAVFADYLRMLA